MRAKGYLSESFEDAWERYISPPVTDTPLSKRDNVTTALESQKPAVSKGDKTPLVTDRKAPQMALESQCHVVTDRTGGYGDGEASDGSRDDHRQITEAEYAERFRKREGTT